MSHQITENDIEALAIKYLEKQGFHSFFWARYSPGLKMDIEKEM